MATMATMSADCSGVFACTGLTESRVLATSWPEGWAGVVWWYVMVREHNDPLAGFQLPLEV